MWLRDWLSHLTGRTLLDELVASSKRVEANMATVEESLANLGAAVAGVAGRFDELSKNHAERVAELEAALAAEREAAAATAAAEDAEDVGQAQALADKQAETDAAFEKLRGVGAEIDAQATRLNEVAPVAPVVVPEPETPAEPAEPEAPVVEENPDLTTPEPAEAPVDNGQPEPAPIAPGATDGGTPA